MFIILNNIWGVNMFKTQLTKKHKTQGETIIACSFEDEAIKNTWVAEQENKLKKDKVEDFFAQLWTGEAQIIDAEDIEDYEEDGVYKTRPVIIKKQIIVNSTEKTYGKFGVKQV